MSPNKGLDPFRDEYKLNDLSLQFLPICGDHDLQESRQQYMDHANGVQVQHDTFSGMNHADEAEMWHDSVLEQPQEIVQETSQEVVIRTNPGPRTPRESLPDFANYLKLQDQVTMLRVQLQQARSARLRARADMIKYEAAIAEALRASEQNGYQISATDYQRLLSNAEQARTTVGPLEQQVEDIEFRLVPAEERLVKEGHILQHVMSRSQNVQTGYALQPSPPHRPPSRAGSAQHLSDGPSTVDYFEETSAADEVQYVDPDDIELSDTVDQYAPDLSRENAWLFPDSPDRDDRLELYVQSPLRDQEEDTNGAERVGSAVKVSVPAALMTLHNSLVKYIPESRSLLVRWLLHFFPRRTTLDMINSTGWDSYVWINARDTYELEQDLTDTHGGSERKLGMGLYEPEIDEYVIIKPADRQMVDAQDAKYVESM